MRVGIWGARGDRRGLAVQTETFARRLPADHVLGIDMEDMSPFPADWSGYDPDRLEVVSRHGLDRTVWDRFAAQVDVAYAAETTYLDEVPMWARQTGTPLMVHVNPELCRYWTEDVPRPDLVVVPSPWLVDRMDESVEVIPTPIDRDAWPFTCRPLSDGPLTFVHVVGRRAIHDRNGTTSLLQALRFVRQRCDVLIRTQEPIPTGRLPRGPARVRVEVADLPTPQELYEGVDVSVAPRRYGGQSLPLQEAASLGIPTIMSDVSPQDGWLPDPLKVPTRVRRRFRTQIGPVGIHEVDPKTLARTMDRLSDDRELVVAMSRWADQWAEQRSWDQLGDVWRERLEWLAHR